MGIRLKRTAIALPMIAALVGTSVGTATAQEAPKPPTLGLPALPPPPAPEEVGRWIADAQIAVQDGANMLSNAAAWVADPTPENANKAIGSVIGSIPDKAQRDYATKIYQENLKALNGHQRQMAEVNSAFQLTSEQYGKKSPESMDARHNVVSTKAQMADAAVAGDEEAQEVFSKDGSKEIGAASISEAQDESYDQARDDAKQDKKDAKQELKDAEKESKDSGSDDDSETASVDGGGERDHDAERIEELEKKLEEAEKREDDLKEQNSGGDVSGNSSPSSNSGGESSSAGQGASGGSNDSGGDGGGDTDEVPPADNTATETTQEQTPPPAASGDSSTGGAGDNGSGDDSGSNDNAAIKERTKDARDDAASDFLKANKKLSKGLDKYVYENVRRNDSSMAGASGGNDKAFDKIKGLQEEEKKALDALKESEQAALDAGWSKEEVGVWTDETNKEVDGHSWDGGDRKDVDGSNEYKRLQAAERLRRAHVSGKAEEVIPVICKDGKSLVHSKSDNKMKHDERSEVMEKYGEGKEYDNLLKITDGDCGILEKMSSDGSLKKYIDRVNAEAKKH